MLTRLLGTGLATTGLVASALVLAGPASADPSFVPDADDIVGVGSDTTEFVMTDLAAGYNGTAAGATQKMVSWDAQGSSPWAPRAGAPTATRPNGSTAGKNALNGSGNNTDVNFARSSSGLSSTEISNDLQAFPFAVDGLKVAVSRTVASNAPANLSADDVLKIFNGTYKKWGQIPGYSGNGANQFIKIFTPQAGSGTRNFFQAQLTAIGGAPFTNTSYGQPDGSGYQGVQENQEHDPSLLQNDPNAIAPFSTARGFFPTANQSAVRLVSGWEAKRAIYNVVRGTDVSSAWAQSMFGPNGYLCSDAGQAIVLQKGFAPLLQQSKGGPCGVATQNAPTLTTSTTATATSLTAASSGSVVTLTAQVTRGADGSVEFYEGGTKVAEAPAISGDGTAVGRVTGVTPGAHSYTARYVPANPAAFAASESAASTVTVKGGSSVTATATRAAYGKTRTVAVTVKDQAGAAEDGPVTLTYDGATSTAALAGGTATFTLPATAPAGTRPAVATWGGDADTDAGTGTAQVVVDKAAVTLRESFPATVKKRKKAAGSVLVSLAGSSVRPGGTFTIAEGKKRLASGTVTNGSRKVTLPRLKKGKHTLVLTYAGSASTTARTLKFVVKQK